MIPSVGRIVHFTLDMAQVEEINRQRVGQPPTGLHGNPPSGGQVFPMIITRIWDDEPTETSVVQGQVFLDGNDCIWVSSGSQGHWPGQWFEPPRV